MSAVIVLFDFTANLLQRCNQIGCCFRAISVNGTPTCHAKSYFLDHLRLGVCHIAGLLLLASLLLLLLLLLVKLLLRIQV